VEHNGGRTGRLWKWNSSTGKTENVGRVAGRDTDKRWGWAIAGLLVYGGLWIALIQLRRATSFQAQSTAEKKTPVTRSTAFILLLLICFFEISKLAANILRPMEIISQENLFFVFGHLLLGATALLLVASIAVLRIPARWALVIPAALVLAGGAALDVLIFFAASASV